MKEENVNMLTCDSDDQNTKFVFCIKGHPSYEFISYYSITLRCATSLNNAL